MSRGNFEIVHFCLDFLAVLIQYFKKEERMPLLLYWYVCGELSCVFTFDFSLLAIHLSGEYLRGRNCSESSIWRKERLSVRQNKYRSVLFRKAVLLGSALKLVFVVVGQSRCSSHRF